MDIFYIYKETDKETDNCYITLEKNPKTERLLLHNIVEKHTHRITNLKENDTGLSPSAKSIAPKLNLSYFSISIIYYSKA